MKFEWKGVFPAVTTKFTADDQLDLHAFDVNLKAQLEAGVDGIILGGSLGEASTLTLEEKDILLKHTVKSVAGKVPVLMNVAEQSTKVAVDAAIRARDCGADGLMLLPPMRYTSDDRETVAFLRAVAQATELPIILYNNPADYKIWISPDMFRQLEDLPTIQAVKESTRDISNITRMKNAFGDRFAVLTGVDTLGMESLLMGADGWVAGLVCAFPRETVAIYRLIKAGKIQEALAIYRWFLPVLELDVSTKLVQNIKLAETFTGLGNEIVREPRLPLVGDERARIVAILEKAMETRPELPDYLNL
ncbi:dihydrodipicolinate synthase family protein [Mangrovibacterium marinum]|uniref:4-hydroxy-tetrahydrodipicolinate synthase n=1 Tax=Mangrovibacterium marinum TaxID=1639118 RepID=A0A2T5BYU9_9BACT|nr:dihydrodipicolinate synthase family protein [Mangrovibacterium marinum]PTN07432.1 4-hydroxy-tetrahydrodipicolinate synthase [Mangrovibacterium marinum]